MITKQVRILGRAFFAGMFIFTFWSFPKVVCGQTKVICGVVEWGRQVHPYVELGTGFQAIAAGDYHSLALKKDGTVIAWGYSDSTVPTGLSDVRTVSAGYYHSLALKSDGTVVAWGNNDRGQSTVPEGLKDVKAISAGGWHNLALKEDGTVVAWGYNQDGQSTVPEDLRDVIAISAGGWHNLALKSDGTVVAWGHNQDGQSTVPAGLSDVQAVSAGYYHSLALKSDGTVVAWGHNDRGQSTVPEGLRDIKAISAGGWHSLALKSDDTVVAWGYNQDGQSTVPVSLSDVKVIAAGGWHSLALKENGTVVGWGRTNYGQSTLPVGLNNVKAMAGGWRGLTLKKDGTVVAHGYSESTVSDSLHDAKAIAAGDHHNLALKKDGTVIVWGNNDKGQSTVPVGLKDVKAIAAGGWHSLALKSDGTVVAWGDNDSGQSTVPSDLREVIAIAAGYNHSLALRKDGTVIAWGYNEFGQSKVPADLNSVKAISAGYHHSLALKKDGTVIAWGKDQYDQSKVPDGLSNVKAIAAGVWYSLALKEDGTVIGWGYNNFGQSTVPGGLNNVKAIAAGYGHSLALKADGTVVVWGRNDYGQSTAPVGLKDVTAISAGFYHSLAIVDSGVFQPDMDQLRQSQKSGFLNVRDFGAKGDGITDDSDAIQRALLQAGIPEYSKFLYWAWTAAPEVYFPEGTYIISRTLLVPICGGSEKQDGIIPVSNHITLRGENATIKQTDPTQDILYFRHSHRNLIEGLTFEGGRRHIKLWSRNLDEARVVIRDCTFRNSSSYAIDDQLRYDPANERQYWAWLNILEPYQIETNEEGLPILTAIDENRYPMSKFVSTGMRISNCSFQRCKQVLSVWADWALMDNCRIETHPEMEGPAILSGAALMLEDVNGLAHVTPGKQQWWITVHPQKQPSGIVSLDLKNVKLKSDSEKGMCVVHNESKFTGGCHVYIIADGCEFQSAGSEENSIIYLGEAPNIINVRNCRETSGGRKVDLLGFKKPFDEDYFYRHSPEVFSFLVEDNNRNLITNLPKTMQSFSDKPLPEKATRRFEVEPTTVTLFHMREGITTQLNVMDFGAVGNGATDDSAAFQKAFTAAREKAGLVEVIVPAGCYLMSQPVELPPRVVVRGVGNAALTVPSGRKGTIFTVSGAEHIVVQNLHFFYCEQAIEITTKTESKSNILIDYCKFYRNSLQAITCQSGTGAVNELNETTLRISDCTFSFCNSALVHNARYALMDNPWISTDPQAADSGVIINKGFFHLKAFIGVPRDTVQHWVDNYGDVFMDRCRFGGENGGLPMVGNFTASGEVLIQNSWLMIYASFTGKPKPITVVDCKEIPALIALRGNWGWPFPAKMVTVREGAQGELEGRFFESGNTAPRTIKDERIKEIVQKPFYYPLPAGNTKFPVSTSAGRVDGLPREISIDLGAGIFMDMILVLPGTFTMGSPVDEKGHRENENQQHAVRITKPFYLGKHEVPQAVWERVMTAKIPSTDSNSDPLKRYWSGSYHFDGSYAVDITCNPRPSSFDDPQLPVENVSWRQSKEFLARLNLLVDGGGFRLPTEGEWEYASRAGTSTAYFFGNDAAKLGGYAWYKSNGGGETHRIGTKQPNPWGFYDMYGNVWEWCEDQFTEEPYSVQEGTELLDPCLQGSANGNQYQVVRGGSFAFSSQMCRSANRSGFDAWHFNHDIGLRLVKTIPAADK